MAPSAFLGFYSEGHKVFTEQSVFKYEKFEKIHTLSICIWMANTEKISYIDIKKISNVAKIRMHFKVY